MLDPLPVLNCCLELESSVVFVELTGAPADPSAIEAEGVAAARVPVAE